ncbi:SGNH/GDSL hydrolase family protein [Aeromicrobium wangtongii]|uniref:SGNH/GDSL hydrolase family protein n=1 Tax=Aeromicrobium wangtongii TaxID=2969247 RepID=A0ABY5M654_9ACTN|nr:SGNH/GDSL hydrolase family protein [Aeromicrobium wangtongii]MCD9200038.1 SGNH/GDSL hydrolase family protein [Aeromicrobium wangtongii]UUP13297.1 SGNH/GDSL hydrolase family protein [Aeromicrobium wangtongii]
MSFHRYVALGDSFTEGVGDPDPTRPNGVRGWADRMAAELAGDDFTYANLAIRGRKLLQIVAEQLEPAIAMKPDLVTIYAGANDVLRPRVDIDNLMATYDVAIGRLTDAGARVVMFTAYDPGESPVFGALRGRFAIYNELVREIAERHDAVLVDFWRLRDYRDDRLWDIDRMHMSSAGHQRMAIAVLDTLGIAHDLKPLEVLERPLLTSKQRRAANLEWAKSHAGPWVKRRLTGTSSGDGLRPRWPALAPVTAG